MNSGLEHPDDILPLPCGIGCHYGRDSGGLGGLRERIPRRQAEHNGHLPRDKPTNLAVPHAANVPRHIILVGASRIRHHKKPSHPFVAQRRRRASGYGSTNDDPKAETTRKSGLHQPDDWTRRSYVWTARRLRFLDTGRGRRKGNRSIAR